MEDLLACFIVSNLEIFKISVSFFIFFLSLFDWIWVSIMDLRMLSCLFFSINFKNLCLLFLELSPYEGGTLKESWKTWLLSLNWTLDTLHLALTLMMNWVPCPISLYTFTDPPIDSIICLQIESPSPVPWRFLDEDSSSFPKSINRFLSPFSEIPMPVSIMLILMLTHISYPILLVSGSFDLL